MKSLLRYWVRSLPFTIGVAAILIAMCFLVSFYQRGLDFEEEFWTFVVFSLVGMPLMLFGIEKLSKPD